jgi:hypothetical protein
MGAQELTQPGMLHFNPHVGTPVTISAVPLISATNTNNI